MTLLHRLPLITLSCTAAALGFNAVSGRHAVSAATSPASSEAIAPETTGTASAIERLDPALDAIVPAGSKLERLATGFTWVEGPVWIPDGYLLFAEITSNSIRKLAPDNSVSIVMQPTGYKGSTPYGGKEPGSNGMTLDPRGRLTVAGHAGRSVWRLESLDPKAQITILADTFEGHKLSSPNDLVYRSDGSLYFTDPPYGLRSQGEHDPDKELEINGVYRIPNAVAQQPGAPPNRSALQLLIKDIPRPNGIAFSPDEKFLYVADSSERKLWMVYPVHHDGSLGVGKVFSDASGDKRPGSPDGIKVDERGNVYSSGPGGLWILSPKGKHLGTIPTPKNTANMAWGGPDRKTLYITATDSVYRIHLNIPGAKMPGVKMR